MKDMNAVCVHSGCGGAIKGDVETIPRYDKMNMPCGPISESNYILQAKIWCEKCGVSYEHPPGQPDARSQLLTEKRQWMAEVQRSW